MTDAVATPVVPLNLFQKLSKVREKIGYVQKDEKKIDGKYRGVTHDAVTALVRSHLVEYAVIIVPTQVSCETIDTGNKTSGGAKIWRVISCFDVWFIDADNPVDRVSMRVWAHGDDTGDKGPGKAFSYAVKYAILKILSLESGDEEESRIQGKAQMEAKELADHFIAIDDSTTVKDLTAAWQNGVARAKAIGDNDAVKDITERASKRKGRLVEAQPKQEATGDKVPAKPAAAKGAK